MTAGKVYYGSRLISSGASGGTGYQRPGDWLSIPDMSSTEGFSGLHAVWNDDANFCAFTCTGAYTVDWGDGSTPEDFASNTIAYHNFNWADYDASTLTSRGYRQAVVTVTPQSGQSLTNINLAVKHNQSGLVSGYSSGWLDLELYGPNLTNLSVSSSAYTTRHRLLEQCTLKNIGNLTNMSYMFNGCSSLQKIWVNSENVTDMTMMFNGCGSLKSVELSDTSSVTNMNRMFQGATSIQSIPLFDTSSVTTMPYVFSGCFSLNRLPGWDMAAVTNVTGMFLNCTSLARVEATGISRTVSFANCKLSSADLDEIYTNLATVTGQTITVTGNYGTSGDDPTIATAKGWTVTG
jgi:surface protein